MNTEEFDDLPDDDETPLPPSKSQRKREATALQKLGEQLVKLTPTQLKKIPLPEDLLEAVKLAQATTQRGGHKRQLQYIGRLMRQIDDPEPIRTAMDTMLKPQHATRRR